MFHKFIALGSLLAFAIIITGCGTSETAQTTGENLSSEKLFGDSNETAETTGQEATDPASEAKDTESGSDDSSSPTPVDKEEKKPDTSPPDAGVKPTIGFVTNGIASFWVIAEAGARAAAAELGVNVEVRMPPSPEVENQKRMLEELATLEVDGVAVSPIDPDNQNDLLNMVAENTNLITHDSDAPKSNRLGYVGMSNYSAGRMCGELVKEALPDGGSLIIFVGRLEQLNARQRRQGVSKLGIGHAVGFSGNAARHQGDIQYIHINAYIGLCTLRHQPSKAFWPHLMKLRHGDDIVTLHNRILNHFF